MVIYNRATFSLSVLLNGITPTVVGFPDARSESGHVQSNLSGLFWNFSCWTGAWAEFVDLTWVQF